MNKTLTIAVTFLFFVLPGIIVGLVAGWAIWH